MYYARTLYHNIHMHNRMICVTSGRSSHGCTHNRRRARLSANTQDAQQVSLVLRVYNNST